MKKKTFKLLSVVLVLLMLTPLMAQTAFSETYWDAQAAYVEALSSGDVNALCSAVDRIRAIYSKPKDVTEATRVLFPNLNAGKACEKAGDFKKAAFYYQNFLDILPLAESGGTSYYDYKQSVEAQLRHCSVTPTVYAETADVDNVPYYSARAERKGGVDHGMCITYDENLSNSYLLYVTFFSENIESLKWQLPKNTNDYTLVVGWNVPNEDKTDLDRIANGDADEYIRKNLEFLSTLDCRVLIRFGAEVNTWTSLPSNAADVATKGQEFIKLFKDAFIRVSKMARKYAPNTGMVYSVNDVSNWYFSYEDFYPGDEYVDWVGISAYMNNSRSKFERPNGNDAYYSHGCYEDQIIKIQEIVETFGDRKPIMISEGGYCYSSTDGLQNEEHAASMMDYFYTYVTRVYPQIKCIMYFNASPLGNKYRLFGDGETSESLAELYTSLVRKDKAMEYAMGRSDICGYTEITNIDEVTDTLNLSVYASYPSTEDIHVKYTVDVSESYESVSYPYDYSISVDKLGVGEHLLEVDVSCEKVSEALFYTVKVNENGKVTVTDGKPTVFKDVKSTYWGYDAIFYCKNHGLINGMTETTFEPNTTVTRAMFVTLLGRLENINTDEYDKATFDDSPAGKWFSPYVAWAKENGIVNGKTDKLFDPGAPITREQMCTILIRYAESKGIGFTRDKSKFKDDGKISNYAKDSVYKAVNAGLVNGKGDGKFEPAASAVRAEAATILMRYVKTFNS